MTLLDGGFGTMVQAAGLPPGKDPAEWNIENPNAVTDIHRAYVDAGSRIVLTNTFGANRLKYHGPHPLGDVIAAAVRNARTAVSGLSDGRVALDIGPTGRLLSPRAISISTRPSRRSRKPCGTAWPLAWILSSLRRWAICTS